MNSPRHTVSGLETAVAVTIGTLYYCDILRVLSHSGPGADAIFRVVGLLLYGATVLLLAPHARALIHNAVRTPLLLALTVLPIVSTFWSISPIETLVRSTTLLGSSLFGYYIAIRYSARGMLRLLALVAFVVAVLSLLLIVFVPSLGIDHKAPWIGAWKGAFLQKNGLGGGMALGSALLIVYLSDRRSPAALWPKLALALSLLLLFTSQSVSAQVAFGVTVVGLFMTRHALRLLRPTLIPLGTALLPVIFLPAIFLDSTVLDDIVTGLGRDVSFSGRIPLWNSVWPFIENRFWLGYGYEAFWINSMDTLRIVEEKVKWAAPNSHNGVLELLLSVGAVGLALFVAMFALMLKRLTRVVLHFPLDTFSSMAVVIVLMFMLRNVSEIALLTRHDIVWCMIIALSLKLRVAVAAMQGEGARSLPGSAGRIGFGAKAPAM